MKKKDLIGKRFGKLIVISEEESYISPKGQKQSRWLCLCECGNKTITTTGKLKNRKNIGCGCQHNKHTDYKKGNQHLLWTGYKEITGSIWCRMKASARTKKYKFDITKKYAWELFLKQNRKCALSGVELSFAKNAKELKSGKNKASLDRIDSSKGYIEGNVQWVHPDVNYMKQRFSQKYFIEMCEKIYKYNKKDKNNENCSSSNGC